MSEPITLTERERAVFARISRNLYRAANELPPGDIEVHSAMFQVGMVLERMWREDAAKAESASPPRVPAKVDEAVSFLRNIADAAKTNKTASELSYSWRGAWASIETMADAAIRALADKFAPDPSKGG